MVTKKQSFYYLAIVLTLIGGTITGILLTQDNLSINIKSDSSTFKSKVNGVWITTGIEKLYLDGKLLSGNISQTINGKQTTISRGTFDSYTFDASQNAIENFPVAHTINIKGSKGKVFKYVVSSLKGVTSAHDVTSPASFAYNMKVTFDSGYASARVTKAGVMTVTYIVPSDDWVLNVRLFDPLNVTNVSISNVRLYKINSTTVNVTWNTNVLSTTHIIYGTDKSNLNNFLDNNTGVYNHSIIVNGLNSTLVYYYTASSKVTQ